MTSTLSSSSSDFARNATAAHYHYYAPVPLRVVNEDYALIAGFVGGILIFVLYVGVLTCLRCVQQLQKQQPQPWSAQVPPQQQQQQQQQVNANTQSVEMPQYAAAQLYSTYAPASPSLYQSAGVSNSIPTTPPAASVNMTSATSQYTRGIPPPRLAEDLLANPVGASRAAAAPTPPPRLH